MGAEYMMGEIPAELKKKADAFHTQLVETVAENDDDILHKFLEGESISDDELQASLRKSTIGLKCSRSWWERHSRTKVSSRCSTRWWIICPRRSMPKKSQASIPTTGRRLHAAPTDKEPFSALAFKIMADPFVGQLTFIRVYSGQLKSGESVLISRTQKQRAHWPPAQDARQ